MLIRPIKANTGDRRSFRDKRPPFIERPITTRCQPGLLPGFASESFLLQGGKYGLVIEVTSDFERLGAFGDGVLLDARNGFESVIDRLDTLSAAKMDPLYTQRLHLGAFCAAAGIHGDRGVTALAEISSTGQGAGCFLHGGSIRPG